MSEKRVTMTSAAAPTVMTANTKLSSARAENLNALIARGRNVAARDAVVTSGATDSFGRSAFGGEAEVDDEVV
ncbi:MAG: hypothetical protein ACT4TC_19580 [Myxococcaceae bacterium]